MANNRQIPTLGEQAFKVLLRERYNFTLDVFTHPDFKDSKDILQSYKTKMESPLFLQHIANGQKVKVINMLINHPELAVLARGTVTTPSEHIINDVSAIQLAYVLEDEEIGEILLSYLNSVKNGREKAMQELAIKIAEVKEQESQFKDYDYSAPVVAITADTQLRDTGKASANTKKALADFREYFKPGVVEKGRPFNMRHLKKSLEVFSQNWNPWNVNQLAWYLEQVNDYLLGLVSPSIAYAFSNGLKKIIDEKQPLKRSFKLENYVNDDDIFYYDRCARYSKEITENLQFIGIYYGCGGARWRCDWAGVASPTALRLFVEQKQQAWITLYDNYKIQQTHSC